ncbi:gamma-glutamylcyclotransferase family protein [Caenimonas aquaedulcis]|uniref:gamma-glutamylcyclotransferase family protein n=1 Tax=Caenimonas aquaedulcis TaxID=2793270 RepID=UPI0018CBD087
MFVFGTLKEGFPNFHINRGRRVAGEFQTTTAYPLYLVGERRSPWMLDDPNAGHCVRGQVFEVDAQALQALDALERVHEPDGYKRCSIRVRPVQGGPTLEAQAYLKDPAQFEPERETSTGPIPEYTLGHAATYQPRPTRKEVP